ncbi:hypothetical protein EDB83DRAFT_2519537 [Lactarius deliciosus]|nr:hypothetical protein EDB83DRAFT_2519537 [Lactarius deliciosus]
MPHVNTTSALVLALHINTFPTPVPHRLRRLTRFMLFELLRSIVRLAWGWVVTVAIGPVGGWMRRRGLRAEFAITLRMKIVSRAEEIVDLVLQPVRLALPHGAAAVQGGEIEEV